MGFSGRIRLVLKDAFKEAKKKQDLTFVHLCILTSREAGQWLNWLSIRLGIERLQV